MKKTYALLICLLLSVSANSQSFIGAWESIVTNEKGDEIKTVVSFADGYQVMTSFEAKTGKFITTNGGSWNLVGDMMTERNRI